LSHEHLANVAAHNVGRFTSEIVAAITETCEQFVHPAQ